MRFVKAKPSEYLVVGRHGQLTSKGIAGSAMLWPGATYVMIPSTKRETMFAMTQETQDGIPLRFKGIVVYRVGDPLKATRIFDFSSSAGLEKISDLISHVCLGELREIVSHMTMTQCIEQRKTTLTNGIAAALGDVVHGRVSDGSDQLSEGWGIELDVIQVAQVFIVDDDLRRQLEAETRNRIEADSKLSLIHTEDEVKLAVITSERARQLEELDHFHVEQFARLVQKMDNIKEGDGTLLDNTSFTLGSGISSGNLHIYTDLPTVVAGGAGGHISGNQHIKSAKGTPIANYWLSLMNAMGVKADHVADSTGALSLS